jgi:hypothetical protein
VADDFHGYRLGEISRQVKRPPQVSLKGDVGNGRGKTHKNGNKHGDASRHHLPCMGFLCSLCSLAAELIPACFQNALGFPKPLKRLAGTDDNKTPG